MKSAQGNLVKSKKYTTPEERRASVEEAYNACTIEDPVKGEGDGRIHGGHHALRPGPDSRVR